MPGGCLDRRDGHHKTGDSGTRTRIDGPGVHSAGVVSRAGTNEALQSSGS
jgi:hypothetical protein